MTPEATATVEPVTNQADDPLFDTHNWLDDILSFVSDDILGFISENWEFIVILVALVFAGRNAPPELIQRGKDEAAKTETPIDDIVMRVFERLQGGSLDESPLPSEPSPDVVEGVVINGNPKLLDGEPMVTTWPNSERTKGSPAGYTLAWAGGRFGTPPETIVKEEYCGMRIEVTDRDGVLFIECPIEMFYAGTRYELAVEYDAVLNLKDDYSGKVGSFIWWEAAISDSHGAIHKLDNKHGLVMGGVGSSWIFGFNRMMPGARVQLQLVIHEAAFTDHSHVDVHMIKVVPKAKTFGGSAVQTI